MADHSEFLPWPEHTSSEPHRCNIRWFVLSLDVTGAKALVEKIASNQSWKGERQQQTRKGIHHVDSVDMLATKMDLLMKKLKSPH